MLTRTLRFIRVLATVMLWLQVYSVFAQDEERYTLIDIHEEQHSVCLAGNYYVGLVVINRAYMNLFARLHLPDGNVYISMQILPDGHRVLLNINPQAVSHIIAESEENSPLSVTEHTIVNHAGLPSTWLTGGQQRQFTIELPSIEEAIANTEITTDLRDLCPKRTRAITCCNGLHRNHGQRKSDTGEVTCSLFHCYSESSLSCQHEAFRYEGAALIPNCLFFSSNSIGYIHTPTNSRLLLYTGLLLRTLISQQLQSGEYKPPSEPLPIDYRPRLLAINVEDRNRNYAKTSATKGKPESNIDIDCILGRFLLEYLPTVIETKTNADWALDRYSPPPFDQVSALRQSMEKARINILDFSNVMKNVFLEYGWRHGQTESLEYAESSDWLFYDFIIFLNSLLSNSPKGKAPNRDTNDDNDDSSAGACAY